MSKPVLLYCRSESPGVGKMLRCLMLARSLSRQFQVVIVDYYPLPNGIEAPAGVEILQMPGGDSSKTGDRRTLISKQREFIVQQYTRLNPKVVLIDTFPFSDGGDNSELPAMLEAAKAGSGDSALVLCSLPDIRPGNGRGLQKEDRQTAELLDRYFDAVLVHSDPIFSCLEETFRPTRGLKTPVIYTGFLSPGRGTICPPGAREKRVLVSAGGGTSGGSLFRTAVGAHELLWEAEQLSMTIVTGPMLHKREFQELLWLSRHSQALTLKRTVPNIGLEMKKVRWSVSQCGYSTAVETISSGVTPLFAPSKEKRCAEHLERARRLVHWGIGRLLVESHLNAVSLANELLQLIKFEPRDSNFDMNGFANTVSSIDRLISGNGVEGSPGIDKSDTLLMGSSGR